MDGVFSLPAVIETTTGDGSSKAGCMKNRSRVHQMPSKPDAELSRPFVVVVDDEKRIADTLVLILKSKGYAAQAAHDGASALAIFRQKVPNLVVSDVGNAGHERH